MSDINAYTAAEIAALTPLSGDLVLNTDDNAVQLWNGSAWKIFSSDVSPFQNEYSLSFDGAGDYVSTELSVAGESELTVSAWVKLDNSSATQGFVTQYVGNNDRAFRLAYFPNLQSMWFEAYGSGSYAGYRDASITTGTWYHVAGVFSQSSCVVYVNGVASTTTEGLHNSATGNIATCTDNIDIGRIGNTDSHYMQGDIDEVGIWTSALSASDIASLRDTSGANAVPADISSLNPVGWWRMGDNDGGTGGTITDQGVDSNGNPSGNDGTINGATFVSGDGNIPG